MSDGEVIIYDKYIDLAIVFKEERLKLPKAKNIITKHYQL